MTANQVLARGGAVLRSSPAPSPACAICTWSCGSAHAGAVHPTGRKPQLFSFKPAAPLRPFAKMVKEILDIEAAYIQGIAVGEWVQPQLYGELRTKDDLLAAESLRRRSCSFIDESSTAERYTTWVTRARR